MTLGYEKYGRGPHSVIVLHEWMSTHRSYEPIRPYLDAETFTYFFVDHRGYGLSRGLSGQHTVSEAASDVLKVADVLGLTQFHLVGHSMSGMIAQWLSIEAADRLKSVTLVTPVPATGMPLDEEGQNLFEGAIVNDQKFETVNTLVTGNKLGKKFYKNRLQQFRSVVDTEAFSGFLKMWTTTNFSSRMQEISIPALVIAGEYDIPAFQEEAYQSNLGLWYKEGEVKTMRGVGHFPMAEAPPHFAAVLESFMNDHL